MAKPRLSLTPVHFADGKRTLCGVSIQTDDVAAITAIDARMVLGAALSLLQAGDERGATNAAALAVLALYATEGPAEVRT